MNHFSNTTLCECEFVHNHIWLNTTICLLFIIYSRYLSESKARDFDDFTPACDKINHHHAGEPHIFLNYLTTWMMLSSWLVICSYQVDVHQIPQFLWWNNLMRGLSIKSLSPFELLPFLLCLNGQICLCY